MTTLTTSNLNATQSQVFEDALRRARELAAKLQRINRNVDIEEDEPFICFIKYRDYKFNIVVKNDNPLSLTKPEQTFGDIYKKIDQIFRIALNRNFVSNSYVFELVDGISGVSSLVSDHHQKINRHSVITIWRKPSEQPQSSVLVQSVQPATVQSVLSQSATVSSQPQTVDPRLDQPPVQPCPIQSNTVQPVPIQSAPAEHPPVQTNSVQTNSVQSDPVPACVPPLVPPVATAVPPIPFPVPQFVPDRDIQFLELNTLNLIAFYLMIDCIDLNMKLKSNSNEKWEVVCSRVLDKYPNIFDGFTADKCKNLFSTLIQFYIMKFDKLNMGLPPRIQRRFDMLKIVHILDIDKVFVKELAVFIKKNGQDPMIKCYQVKQHQYGFDMFLNINRDFNPMVTYEEFLNNYVENNYMDLRCAN